LPYMAPEQIRAEKVTGQADQFSLAVVGYRMLAGQMPFLAEHDAALMYKILSEAPPPIDVVNPLLPRGVSAVMLRGLAKTPEARFGSCTEFISELAKACAPQPSPPAPPIRERPAPQPITRPESSSKPQRAPEILPATTVNAHEKRGRTVIPYVLLA